MTAVHGRFTRSQTLIQNGKPGLWRVFFFSPIFIQGGFISYLLITCSGFVMLSWVERLSLLLAREEFKPCHFVTLNFIKHIILFFKFCRCFHIDAFVMYKNKYILAKKTKMSWPIFITLLENDINWTHCDKCPFNITQEIVSCGYYHALSSSYRGVLACTGTIQEVAVINFTGPHLNSTFQPFFFVRWGDWQCGQGRQHPSPHRCPLWAWTPHQHAHHQRSRLHKVCLFSPLYENVSPKQRWGVKFCTFLSRQGVHGMLPLHLAALNAHSDCCRKLLSSGNNAEFTLNYLSTCSFCWWPFWNACQVCVFHPLLPIFRSHSYLILLLFYQCNACPMWHLMGMQNVIHCIMNYQKQIK